MIPDLMIVIFAGVFIVAVFVAVLLWGYADGVIGRDAQGVRYSDGSDGEGALGDSPMQDRLVQPAPAALPEVSALPDVGDVEARSRRQQADVAAPRVFEAVQLDRYSAGRHLPDRVRWTPIGRFRSLAYAVMKVESRRQSFRAAQDYRLRWFFVRDLRHDRVVWAVEGVGDELELVIGGTADRDETVEVNNHMRLHRVDLIESESEARLRVVDMGAWSSRFAALLRLSSHLQGLETNEWPQMFVIRDERSGAVETIHPHDSVDLTDRQLVRSS